MASGAGPAALAYNTSLASLNAVPTANDLGRPLNRYIDMSRDQFIEKVRQLIAEQVFEQIGHPEIRLEGQTAWGV